MAQAKKKRVLPSGISAAVENVLGAVRTLPGESDSEYREGLQDLIEELEAKTVLQVYLAEKIYECLWWMRRYEQQKRTTLAREIAKVLNNFCDEEDKPSSIPNNLAQELIEAKKRLAALRSLEDEEKNDTEEQNEVEEQIEGREPLGLAEVMEIVLDPHRHKEFENLLKESEHTEKSLLQQAFGRAEDKLEILNRQISVLAKTLSGFQASFEVHANRKLASERLRLQNALLLQDLNATLPEVTSGAGQPKKTSSK